MDLVPGAVMDTSMRWDHVPDEPPAARSGSPLAWAAVNVPLLVALRNEAPGLELLWLVVATALMVCAYRFLATILPAAMVSVLVGVGLALSLGPAVAAIAWLLTTGWMLVLGAAPDEDDRARFRPMIGPLVLAGGALLLARSLGAAFLFAVIAAVVGVLIVAFPAAAAPVVRVGNRIGSALGRVVGAVFMVPAALVVAGLSVVYRLVGHDPLGIQMTGWRSVPNAPVPSPERGFDPAARWRTTAPTRRRRYLAHTVVIAVLAMTAFAFVTKPPSPPMNAAFAHDPDWPDVWRQQYEFNTNGRLDNVSVFATADFESEYVNQVDGVRRTWSPPACDCQRIRIWWFGGSAAWGFYQADMDTIPSQLARLAWNQGIALEIENFAVPGHSLAQEAQRFAQLSVTEQPPDLAVFYDGANELYLQEARNIEGRGDDESVASYADDTLSGNYSGVRGWRPGRGPIGCLRRGG